MGAAKYVGVVKTRVIELRFAFSGKTASVNKVRGNVVNKGEVIASLEKVLLQTELDKQLADYEKARAEWEMFNLKYPQPGDDMTKFMKISQQASLNAAVKGVESAKFRIDQSVMTTPISGTIIDDGNLVSGMYVTPASNAVKIVENKGYEVVLEIKPVDIGPFLTPRDVMVIILGLNKEGRATTLPLVPSDDKKFYVRIPVSDITGIISGMEADIEVI